MQRTHRDIPVADIKPNPRNTRTHSSRQIKEIAESIRRLGFGAPLLVDENSVLIAGEGRWKAAKLLNLKEIPAIVITGLSEAKKRALAVADNKIATHAGWDRERLAVELPELSNLLKIEGLDISLTGFEPPEIDQLAIDFEDRSSDPVDEWPTAWSSGPHVTRPGDLWHLGGHRLLCGDARSETDVTRLMAGRVAAACFLDPLYNLRVRNIGGRGRKKHPEFQMASGEMTRTEFIEFLVATLGPAARASKNGAISFICVDWRHVGELIAAGERVFGEMINLVTWVKSNAGQGSFYRSQHELIGVFRVGDAASLNNIQLGRHGRNRSNVWHYAGVNTFRPGRQDELAAHPTPKPVALVADAFKDCTNRHDVVLDSFAGSGTTILAAERVGRLACGLEIEPHYVDVAIRRWQEFTGKDAIHVETNCTFSELADVRPAPAAASTEDDTKVEAGTKLKRPTARGRAR